MATPLSCPLGEILFRITDCSCHISLSFTFPYTHFPLLYVIWLLQQVWFHFISVQGSPKNKNKCKRWLHIRFRNVSCKLLLKVTRTGFCVTYIKNSRCQCATEISLRVQTCNFITFNVMKETLRFQLVSHAVRVFFLAFNKWFHTLLLILSSFITLTTKIAAKLKIVPLLTTY